MATKKPVDRYKNVYTALGWIEHSINYEWSMGYDILIYVLGNIDKPQLAKLKAFLKKKKIKFTKDGKVEIAE